MATSNAASNQPTDVNSISGGVVKVTLSSGVGQGNDGTSLTCRSCIIKEDESNSAVVTMNIGAAADANDFPLGSHNGTAHEMIPLEYEIDDVSKLYFYSSDTNAIVYILYRV